MKYIIWLLIAVVALRCSPKISPDIGWARQRWVVVEMKGVPVQQSGTRRDAYISFEVGDKKISGNGGCNQLTANYSINKNDISFSEVTTTKMSCDDIEFENTFISLLSGIDRYEINENNIILKRKREALLVLKSR